MVSSSFGRFPHIFDPYPLFKKLLKSKFIDRFPQTFGPFPHFLFRLRFLQKLEMVKWAGVLILSAPPPFKVGHKRFSAVPFKYLSAK